MAAEPSKLTELEGKSWSRHRSEFLCPTGDLRRLEGLVTAPVPEQRLARCVAESTLLPGVFVALWVPDEFFTDASPELVREMSAVVLEFSGLWRPCILAGVKAAVGLPG